MSKLEDKGKADGRSRRDGGKEREWRRIIDEQRRGGESVRAFCRKRQLRESSFYRWRREIELRDREVGSKVLAPVVFVDESRDASTDRTATSIEIVLGCGTMVRFGPDAGREQLATVMEVLGQARC